MKTIRQRLLGSSVMMAAAVAVAAPLGLAALPSVAAAQTASSTPAADQSAAPQEVVVTGSIIRHRNADSDAPLTVVTSADLDQRGLTTIQSAVQNLSGNNSGALPNSFSANGAFAAGASGASLRGLTTNSTLVLVDGLRAAYYPIADDGVRNFVDLNTIPDVIVDRVEVLQDGASAVYGADAIAGVINVITKKSYQGLMLKAEGGWSQHGGGDTRNFQALFGKGDLGVDGWNAYVGVEYQKDDALYNRDRGYPYNTADQSKICSSNAASGCLNNNIANGLQYDGGFEGLGTTTVAVVRPYTAAAMNGNSTAGAITGSQYQLLNPAAGCGNLPSVTVTANMLTAPSSQLPLTNSAYLGQTYCQQDFTNQYSVISPEDERFSISGHFIKNLGANAQVYAEVNYYQNDVYYQGAPLPAAQNAPPIGTGPRYLGSPVFLPVFVCPEGSATHTCTAADGGATLNPNNPFAAAGNQARLVYDFGDIPVSNETFSQTFRFATGINGSFGDGWHYTADLTGMQSDLENTYKGQIYIANLLTAINQGTYNFANPSQNTATVRNFVSPTLVQDTNSKLLQLQATISKPLFRLPGGDAVLAIGVSGRYESLYDPSANPEGTEATASVDRYYNVNPFFSEGEREVYSTFGELDLPFLKDMPFAKLVDVDLAARYDRYSTGQDHISPKVGLKYKPFDMLLVRATYSEGFRIPSFAEEFGQVTGYVTAPQNITACNTAHPESNSAYCKGYSLGETTVGSTNLNPETSQNFTGGFVLTPIRNLSFSIDYYRIKKSGVIATPNVSPALDAYYATGNVNPLPGFTIIPDAPDINHPNAIARAAFVQYSAQNLNSLVTDGYDIAANWRQTLPWWNIKWSSTFEGTYVGEYNLTLPDGSKERYVGTLGPFNTTSGSGTPQFRWNWSNTVDFGRASLTATIYYTSGYKTTAEDLNPVGTRGDCAGASFSNEYIGDGSPAICHVGSFTDVQLHGTFDVTKKIQLYFDIDNLLDAPAPFDPATYGGFDYNPAWANSGIYGRYFKIGVKANF